MPIERKAYIGRIYITCILSGAAGGQGVENVICFAGLAAGPARPNKQTKHSLTVPTTSAQPMLRRAAIQGLKDTLFGCFFWAGGANQSQGPKQMFSLFIGSGRPCR